MAPAKKIVNGIQFDANTPDRVVDILLKYMGNRDQRIRVFYGDAKTGRDWCEELYTMGYVSKSGGRTPVPLLINNSRSMGGDAISTSSIVRITVNRRDVYRHPKYKCDVVVKGKEIYINGQVGWVCPSHEKAEKGAAFLRGDSNTKG